MRALIARTGGRNRATDVAAENSANIPGLLFVKIRRRPRIVGKAIGLHPIVSLMALIAGAELFGIWGALFASPIAGILQALLVAFWIEWRNTHLELFQKEKEQAFETIEAERNELRPYDKPVS